MCLAIFKPKNEKIPPFKTLETAWQNNPDGAGLAIVNGESVKIIKGLMTLEDLMFHLSDDSLNGFDLVIHFRWSTSGHVSPEMTHPFPVSTDNNDLKSLEIETQTAIIHNGVMFSPKLDSGYSDTAIFTKYYALKNGLNDLEISEIIGSDRLAIASKDGVKLVGSWHEVDGLHYSNLGSFESRSYRSFNDSFLDDPYFYSSDYAFFDSRRDSYLENEELQFCPCCGSDEVEQIGIRSLAVECLDCGSVFNETHFLESDIITKKQKRKIG